MMGYSIIGVWLAAQVTFTELLHATITIDAGIRRHGWGGVVFGATAALLDFVFIGVGLLGVARYAPPADLPMIAILLLFAAGAYLANKSYAEFKSERVQPPPSPFALRIRSLPISKASFSYGFWSLMRDGGGIVAVWLAISIVLGWRSATVGALLGAAAIVFLMVQTKRIGLSKGVSPSSYYSFAAGVVAGYAVYFFDFVNFSHH